MILVTHFTVAAVIPLFTQNPILIAGLAFLSHFILDMFPHWQYQLASARISNSQFPISKRKALIIDATKGVLDFSLGAVLVSAILFLKTSFLSPSPYLLSTNYYLLSFIAGFFACLPDMIWFLLYLFPKNKLLLAYIKHHEAINSKIDLGHHPKYFLLQVPFIIISLFLILLYT